MREICKTCTHKEKCSYLKTNKTGDCIDVQTSDYGFDEAVAQADLWLRIHLPRVISNYSFNGQIIDMLNEDMREEFRNAMHNYFENA